VINIHATHPRINRRYQSDPEPSEIDGNLSIDCSGLWVKPHASSVFIPFKKGGIHFSRVSVPHIYCQQTSGKRMPSSAMELSLKPVGATHTETEHIIST